MSGSPKKGGGFIVPSADADTQQVPMNISGRLAGVEDLTKTILTVVVISLAAMIVSTVIGVGALILDQMHFNNEVYRDDGYNHTKNIQTTVKVEQPVFFPNMKPAK